MPPTAPATGHAGNIKHWNDDSVRDVWTDGAADETSFLPALKRKMV